MSIPSAELCNEALEHGIRLAVNRDTDLQGDTDNSGQRPSHGVVNPLPGDVLEAARSPAGSGEGIRAPRGSRFATRGATRAATCVGILTTREAILTAALFPVRDLHSATGSASVTRPPRIYLTKGAQLTLTCAFATGAGACPSWPHRHLGVFR